MGTEFNMEWRQSILCLNTMFIEYDEKMENKKIQNFP